MFRVCSNREYKHNPKLSTKSYSGVRGNLATVDPN